jgi:hypothetical protein
MNKGAADNLVLPLSSGELLIAETVPINKFLGFLEDIVDETLKFKEELAKKKDLEALKQSEREEIEQNNLQENKILRGRTRLNAHPSDV